MLNLNYSSLVFLHPFDDALHPGKIAIDHAHTLTGLTGKVEVLDEEHAIVGYRSHTHEIIHLEVRYDDDLMTNRLPFVVVHRTHHIS